MTFDNAINDLKEGLEDFMEDEEYAITDVHTCIGLIEKFLLRIDNSKDKQEGYTLIKDVVISLNGLNNQCGETLIETDQREIIAGIINDASVGKGYSSEDEDVTEEFREW